MNQPFIKKYRLLFLFAATLAMMIVMAKTGATLKTPETPHGILNLEFAYNTEKTTQIINTWTGIIPIDNVFAAIINTWLDFLFLLFYAPFLYYLCKTLSGYFNGSLYTAGKFLAKGALIAGVLDVIENTGMLISLYGHITATTSLLTAIFSVLKWGFVLAAILYSLITGIMVLYKKAKGAGIPNRFK